MAFTFFFRDGQTLEIAVKRLIPAILGQSRIRIWDAGCAHGPETYTIAMLLREQMSEMLFRNVHIHATDVDDEFENQVVNGIYHENELKRTPAEYLDKYVKKAEIPGHLQIVDELRSRVFFQRHDLLSMRPVREDFSLIVCKNVLLHFDEAQRIAVLRMFSNSLRSDGMLVLEQTQKLPPELNILFNPIVSYAQIYVKKAVSSENLRALKGPHVKFTEYYLPAASQ